MSSSWGKNLKFTIFGESHGPSIGAVLDGIPSGIAIDMEELQQFMKRRAPGRAKHSTPRKEADLVAIQSGIYHGKTTGTPLTGMILNTNTRSQDYQNMPLRPSHADYTGLLRYNGNGDPRGGGHFSGRLTTPLTFVGGIAKQVLATYGIYVGAHISSIGTVLDDSFTDGTISQESFHHIASQDFPVINELQGEKMLDYIEAARLEQDSVGGVVSCCAIGVPAGLGSPMFCGLENTMASLVFGIPAVRGIEFGTGFSSTTLRGSEHNDPFTLSDGKIVTTTNHHGGIIGGISSGMPILLNVAFKPTPSISQPQASVDYETQTEASLEIHGRHDPCIVPRAVPVVESAVAIALLDALLEGGNPIAIRALSQRD